MFKKEKIIPGDEMGNLYGMVSQSLLAIELTMRRGPHRASLGRGCGELAYLSGQIVEHQARHNTFNTSRHGFIHKGQRVYFYG